MTEVRKQVLETLIELALQPGSSRETLVIGCEAHELLSGKRLEDAYVEEQLAELYPHLVPPLTDEEVELARAAEGKAKPYYIWNRADVLAYYAATERQRNGWNIYAAGEARAAENELDMGESLSAYTSVDRDGDITSWAPSLWFPEWLKASGYWREE